MKDTNLYVLYCSTSKLKKNGIELIFTADFRIAILMGGIKLQYFEMPAKYL